MCNKCFLLVDSLITHLVIEHGLKKFVCGELNCFRIFDNKKSFKRHLLTHSVSKENIQTNEICFNDDNTALLSTISETKTTHVSEQKTEKQSENNYAADLKFVLNLYNNSTLPRKTTQQIVTETSSLINGLLNNLKINMQEILQDHVDSAIWKKVCNELDDSKQILQDFNTEHKSFNTFHKNNLYIPLKSFTIGRTDRVVLKHYTRPSMKPSIAVGQYVSLKQTI